MRKTLLLSFVLFLALAAKAQNGFVFTCAKDVTISCTESCVTLKANIPDIHSSTMNYSVNSISAGGCFRPPTPPDIPGNTTNLSDDDTYTSEILLPFDFPFYGIPYSSLIASTNGIVSFDVAEAGNFSHYSILSSGTGLTATGTGPGVDLPDTRYDRALIMGIYEDIDPFYTTSPNKQIKYDVLGTAPHRKWVLTFYKIPTYSAACQNQIENTYQISLYEGLGLVEVHLFGREICTNWNQGRAMIGMQNYERDNGIMPPGRAASTNPVWGSTSMNEAWRFVPSDGPTLFKRVELLDLSGNIVATGDTISAGNNTLEASFPNVCPTVSTTYIVRSTYYKWDDPGVEIYGMDTINVTKTTAVPPITETIVPATCGSNPTGTITINTPTGPNYVYSIDGGLNYQASPTFTVSPGTYTLAVKDITSGCFSTKDVTVSSPSTLTASAIAVNTSCPEIANGTITITATQGTPGYTYALDSTTNYVVSNVFGSLTPGTHTVYVKDNAGCVFSFSQDVNSDISFTTIADSTDASCLGISNGSISVNVPTAGTPPFKYSIPGYIAVPQISPLLTGLAGGITYTVKVEDALGCSYSFEKTVKNSAGVTATDSTIVSACVTATTGKIFIKTGTGVAPFTFSKDSGLTFQVPDSFLNLLPGTYHIRVKDNVGCYYDFNSTVGVGPGVIATDSTIVAACATANTGKIFIKSLLGIAPFTYSKDSGLTFQAADSFLNLLPGTYNIRVKDNVGCYFDFKSIVDIGPGVTATDSVIVSACAIANTGKIFIKTGLGIAPFTFSKDSGLTFQPADSFLNLLPGVYHIRVKDNVGCYYDFNSTVGIGPGVTARDSVIVSACAIANTGKIFIKTGLGIAPFTFSKDSGLTFQPADSFLNLLPGVYHIRVKDNVGCYYDFNSTVGIGPGVTARDSVIVSACAIANTGKIFIKPGLGIAPFTFSKDSGLTFQPADSFLNLLPGVYHIRAKDNVGCYYDFNSTVGIGPGVTARDSVIVTACNGVSTGKIFIKTGLGIAPFTFSKDSGVIFQPADSFINLASGTYHIRVKDNVGCYYDFNSTVGTGIGVTATDSTVVSSCAAATTGKIFIKRGLGTAPFTFSKDSGLTFQVADSFVNLAPGTYHIRVKDVIGCFYDLNSIVGIGAGFTATDSTVKSACAAVATGKIFIRPSSLYPPYSFSKDSGITYQLADSFINLAPGRYPIRVKDAIGCTYDFHSTVGAAPGVNANFVKVNSACLGVSSGQIIVRPAAGISPFTYSIDAGVTFQSLDTFKNLVSGNYNILVKDAVGCTFNSAPQTVGNNIGVTATYTLVKAACAGSATGAIIVKPVTGTSVFRYSLDAGVTYQYDSVFRNLAASTYNIMVKDTSGCILNSPVQNLGNNPGVLTSASTIQNASCASVPNGSITVNVTAGIAPFSYTNISVPGSVAQPGNSFGSLFSGSYDITIADSAGCSKTITSVVGNNPKIQIDALSIVRPTCNGLLNGTITVSASLGVAPYKYAIDAGGYGTSKVFSGVGAGPHILHVKDANSCIIDSAITITEPTVLTNSLVGTTRATCSGNPDGQIVVSGAGGTSPYQYTLDAAGLTGYQAAASFPVLAGTYKVTVQDANTCKANVNVVVDSVFTMFLDLGRDTTICFGQSVILSPVTNNETSIFTYTPQGSLDKANIKNPSATPSDTTKYKLTAQWGICKLTASVIVNVLHKPVPDAVAAPAVICYGDSTTLFGSATNLSGTVNYVWSPADLIDGKADTTVVIARPDTNFTYYVVTVTDNYGCNFSVSDSVLVNMLPPVYAFAGNDTNAVLDVPHQLNATGAGVGGTYAWSYPSSGVVMSSTSIADPTATFSPVPQPGTFVPDTNYYKLSVIATNQAGCWATDTVKINVFLGPTYYVPNAFTPNNDGKNDKFRPILVGIDKTEYFRVFNRYGQLVFETSRFMEGWDGSFNGQQQPAGAYVWALKGVNKKGRPVEMKGTVLLVR